MCYVWQEDSGYKKLQADISVRPEIDNKCLSETEKLVMMSC